MSLEELLKSTKIHKAFVLIPEVLLELGSQGLYHFDHSDESKGINLLLLYEPFMRVLQDQAQDPFEKHCAEALYSFITEKGLKRGEPQMLPNAHNTYVYIPDSTQTLKDNPSIELLANFLINEGIISDERRKKDRKDKDNWYRAINSSTIVEVLANKARTLALLSLRNINVKSCQYRKSDPSRIDDYLVEIDSSSPDFALLSELMYKDYRGLIEVPHDDFREAIQPFLPKRNGLSQFLPNQYFVFHDNNSNIIVLKNKYFAERDDYDVVKKFVPGIVKQIRIKDYEAVLKNLWDPKQPLHYKQLIALDLLFDRDISRLFIAGGAGCGKTSISFLSLLVQTMKGGGEFREYSRNYEYLWLAKSHEPMGGKNYQWGFLPGAFEEKTRRSLGSYWGVYKNSYFSQDIDDFTKRAGDRSHKENNVLMKNDAKLSIPSHPILEILDLAELRGQNITQLCLLDETQNAPMQIVLSMIDRVSENGKLIMMGDLYKQIDYKDYTTEFNGLVVPMGFYYGDPYAGAIKLTKNFRDMGSRKADEMPRY